MIVRDFCFNRVEDYFSSSGAGTDIALIQLSRGLLDFHSRQVDLDGVTLEWNRVGARFRSREVYRGPGIMLAWVLQSPAEVKSCGSRAHFGDVVVWPIGDEFEYVAPSGLTSLIVLVDQVLIDLLGWRIHRGLWRRVPAEHLLRSGASVPRGNRGCPQMGPRHRIRAASDPRRHPRSGLAVSHPSGFGAGTRTFDWVRFYVLLAISVVMATVGLYRNSVAVVIAAMLIAPLMSPILDIASALVMGWMVKVLRLLLAIGIASVLAITLSFLIPFLVDAPRGMVIPDEVIARTDPGLEELVIAIASGLAGAFVQMRKQEAALLPGVAIGVSLVPPLSAAGLVLYFGEPELAWEAAELFLTNLTAIVLCASVVFVVLGLRAAMREKGYVVRVGTGAIIMLVGVALITLDLARQTILRFQEARDEELVLVAISEWIGPHPVEIQQVDVKGDTVKISLIFDVPLHFAMKSKAPSEMVSDELEAPTLFRSVQEILGRPVETIYRGQLRYSGVLRSSMPELE